MAARVRPGEPAGWSAELKQGAVLIRRDGFTDRDAAEAWCAQAILAMKSCTVRIGSKRFLGSAAEALQRWAIDQGTLPRAEGGTQVAPVRRLAGLMADTACAWPMTLLTAKELAALRRRRQQALGDTAACLAEQAALAAALEQFRGFYLPALDDPFAEPAPDGVHLLDEVAISALHDLAAAQGGVWARLTGLMLNSALPWRDLVRVCHGQAEPLTGCLHLSDGRAAPLPPGWRSEGAPDAALLPGLDPDTVMAGFAALGQGLGQPALQPEALQLTAMVQALDQGRHMDEMLVLAGAVPARRG